MRVELPEPEWRQYLKTVAVGAAGAPTTLQAAPAEVPYRPSRSPTPHPLRDISYAPDRRVFEVAIGGSDAGGAWLRYTVSAPRRLLAYERRDRIALLITDAGGGRTLVRIRLGQGPAHLAILSAVQPVESYRDIYDLRLA
jgi:hypothetical protein